MRVSRPITGQYFHFILPKNTKSQKVFFSFKEYKMGTLARKGLKKIVVGEFGCE